MLKTEDILREHQDNINKNRVPIRGVPKGKEREKGAQALFLKNK